MKSILLGLLLCFASSATTAQPYVSAAYGRANLKAASADGSTDVFRLGAGYDFTDRFGVELAYQATGDASSIEHNIGATTQLVTTARVDTEGFGIFARWSRQLGADWRIGARGGAYRMTAKIEERIVEQDNAPPFNPRVLSDTKRTKTEWMPALGLTADFLFGGSARLGVAYEATWGNTIESIRSFTGYVQVFF